LQALSIDRHHLIEPSLLLAEPSLLLVGPLLLLVGPSLIEPSLVGLLLLLAEPLLLLVCRWLHRGSKDTCGARPRRVPSFCVPADRSSAYPPDRTAGSWPDSPHRFQYGYHWGCSRQLTIGAVCHRANYSGAVCHRAKPCQAKSG
jgi:hypothetical protein